MRDLIALTEPLPAVSIRLARAHLRLSQSDPTSDFELMGYILGAQGSLTNDLGCPTTTQTFKEYVTQDDFNLTPGTLRLWMRPVQSIVHVASISDADNVTETNLNTADYGRSAYEGVVFPFNWQWPTRRMAITYTAGWEPAALPWALRVAVLMQMADLYSVRETVQIASRITVAVNPTAERMTRSYRRFN